MNKYLSFLRLNSIHIDASSYTMPKINFNEAKDFIKFIFY